VPHPAGQLAIYLALSLAQTQMAPPQLVQSRKEGSVAVLELNRPKKRNALSQDLINELIKELSRLDRDVSVRAVILTGSGEGPFCGMPSRANSTPSNADLLAAGADLVELVKVSTAEAYRIGWLKDLNDAVDAFQKPIVAAVRGFAVSTHMHIHG
jgi:enoyl-CoA hydratase